MNHFKSTTNFAIALCAAAICFTACNSSNSSDTTSDTSTTMYTPAPSDTTAGSSSATVDTTTMATTAPDTSASAANNKKPATTSTSKKKGKASVVLLPDVKNRKVQMDKSGVYDYSEVMPSYPGGQNAIEDYVTNHIEYPDAALNDGKEGRVSVAFTVDENGKITDAHTVSNKLGDGLDEEAVRVVSSMPKWTPGTVKGKTVKARMTLPITFQIEQ